MDVELVARLRGVIAQTRPPLNATSTGEGLTPTQYSVLGLIRSPWPTGSGRADGPWKASTPRCCPESCADSTTTA